MSAEAPKRPDTLPSSEALGKASEVCVHQVEAYASIYNRRANLTLVDAPKKPEIQPVDAATMRVSDHLQEYVTMTPTSDSGTLEGGAVANLQQRISGLEESRKEYERNIQQVTRLVWFVHFRGTSNLLIVDTKGLKAFGYIMGWLQCIW